MHLIIPDPVAHIRTLRDQHRAGLLSDHEYRAAFAAASREVENAASPPQCEHERWGKRCPMQALAFARDGHAYCAAHYPRNGGRA